MCCAAIQRLLNVWVKCDNIIIFFLTIFKHTIIEHNVNNSDTDAFIWAKIGDLIHLSYNNPWIQPNGWKLESFVFNCRAFQFPCTKMHSRLKLSVKGTLQKAQWSLVTFKAIIYITRQHLFSKTFSNRWKQLQLRISILPKAVSY